MVNSAGSRENDATSLIVKALRLLVVSVVLAACARLPGRVDANRLAAVPTQVRLDGVALTATTYGWRDFMPGQPNDHLIVVISIISDSAHPVPAGLHVDRAWIMDGRDEWIVKPIDEGGRRPRTLEVVARDGPRWKTGDRIEVVIQLRSSTGVTARVLAASTVIQQTS